jgi:hypothetical protein
MTIPILAVGMLCIEPFAINFQDEQNSLSCSHFQTL